MACILRAGGGNFDVDRFLKRSALVPKRVFRREEPVSRSSPRGKKRRYSGFNVVVSAAEHLDLLKQVRDATRFLNRNKGELRRLARTPGVQSATLDFGVSLDDGLVGGTFLLPKALVALAGDCGVQLEITVWQWEYLGPPPPTPVRRKARRKTGRRS
jgi:hypothetical protein